MIKEISNANENVTANGYEVQKLKQALPQCFTSDGSFNMEAFKAILDGNVNITNESYELKFLGKSYARLLASLDTETIIVPNEEHNSKPENVNSENVYITGDNLDALKHLLKSYEGKIKCIYIDPPYNTGSDGFVYNDKFNFTKDELIKRLSIDDEQADRIMSLISGNSASHSAWLTFVFSRLILARDLLSKDGVFFISIDDNEQDGLKLLCDNIIGEENFIARIIHKNNSMKNQSKYVGVSTEYVLVYSKDIDSLNKVTDCWRIDKKGANDICNLFKKLKNKGLSLDEIRAEIMEMYRRPKYAHLSRWNKVDENGVFKDADLSRANGPKDYTIINPATGKPVPIPSRGWGKSYEELIRLQEADLIYYGDENTPPGMKSYINEDSESVFDNFIFADTAADKKIIKSLFGDEVFEYPKPLGMLRQFIELTMNENDIILDFYAGSSTTAHAVLKNNTENNRKNKFIMVQIAEPTKINSVARKAGYETIDQIGRERIIRAAAKIREEHPETTADLGFKHYILQDVPEKKLTELEDFDPDAMFAEEKILEYFTKPTVLTTWLVKDGYGFNAKVEEIKLDDYTAYYCNNHLYFLDANFDDEAMKALYEKYDAEVSFKPENVVLFGYSFTYTQTVSLKDNLRKLKAVEDNKNINVIVRY
ncbi:MAG: site-specific DNA-methyltransferase [Phascolarctobacterium sp.]|nr:site-specific DNA-methyltransferase [Phascolarctobacterium sp.]